MLALAVPLLATGPASAWHHCRSYATPMTGYAMPMTGYAMPMVPMTGFTMPMSFAAPSVSFTPSLASGAAMNFQMSMTGDASVAALFAPLLRGFLERFLGVGVGGGGAGRLEALLPQIRILLGPAAADLSDAQI